MWTSKVTDPGAEDTPIGEGLAPGLADDIQPEDLADDIQPEDLADDIQPEDSAKTFRDLGVTEPICAALEAAGIITAFPIQALALPIALDGYDLIGQARTGTGKTLAFGIPLLQRLGEPGGSSRQASNAPRALVVVPTRELAIQVADDVAAAGSLLGIKVVALYGGRAYEPQIAALASADLVVGTPGRLLDLSRQRHLDLSRVTGLVLDEADKMLDLGFLPDVEKILALTPVQRQTMLFSATMPGEVVTLARRHLHRPTHVRAEQHDDPVLVPSTEQHVFRAHELDKVEVLARVLQAEGRGLTIVFCRTKRACDHVVTALTERGFAAGAVHGDLGQGQRERAMRAFRTGKVDVLVATDVAARGLDVDDVTHVINLECPEDDKAYLHRIGRTGRAGRTGVAVTFVDWRDLQRWKLINDALGLGKPEPAETYSTSEHLYAALGIPRDAKGTLPRAKRGRLGLEAEEIEDIGETGRHRSREQHRGSDGNTRTRESRPRKQRVRRRTRAGVVPGDGGGKVREPTAAASPSADASHRSVLADETARERSESESRSRRRPRRRGGRGRRAGGTADAAEAAGEAVGASSAAAADGAGPAGSAAESA